MAVTVPVPGHEWWERWRDAWRARLASWPGAARAITIVCLASAAVALVALVAVPGFREGAKAWLACVLMLGGWALVTPTRTVKWTSALRLFALACPWSFLIARISAALAESVRVAPGSAGSAVAIAAIVEETLKLTPLLGVAALAPGRVRRFSIADWFLLGLAGGLAFQATEDFVRQATFRPGLFDLLLGGERHWSYGWTLFGGGFEQRGADFAGHHITTGLVALAIGFAVHVGRGRAGRDPWRWLAWSGVLLAWLVVVCDHIGYNATAQDARLFQAGGSDVPAPLYWTWRLTLHGAGRGWLLLAGVGLALLCDAGRLVDPPGAAVAPAPEGGRPAWGLSHLTAWSLARSGALARLLAGQARWAGQTLRGRLPAVSGPLGLVGLVLAIGERLRRGREDQCRATAGPGSRRTVRVAASGAALASALVALGTSRALASAIGRTLRFGSRGCFLCLLDAFHDWWNGMGPGGQAGLVVGLVGLGVLLVLAPEIVIPVITASGELAILTIPAATTTAAGTAVLGGTAVMMAGAATPTGGEGGGESSGGGSGSGAGESGSSPPLNGPVSGDVRKFSDYVFKEGDPTGKGRVFRDLGYDADDSAGLLREWERQAGEKVARGEYGLGTRDQYGQRITIEIELRGTGDAAGRTSWIRSGWMVRPDGSITLNTPFSGFTR
jgi:hypothetical protein